ncbi:protein kinase domain-containing protein [Iningainema tapete]|uniref:Protein kinase n=1 Tax=Iningainema tapete BLCC-T55 TaxID=2748662 RepID=A0A8J6XGI2_9CYAN|nr:protein kinase [Iningainema tapete]MBD2776405.1 protein kinase [Iningainema tapete BLCC-T55]
MSYKIGDVIAEKYVVTRDFDSANAGQCQWGFVEYNGTEYFIKKFLNPVYPGVSAPGSEKNKQKRRKQCEEFAKRHIAIQEALSSCGEGGLVVTTVDFFADGKDPDIGSHFFKVCQKVDTSSMSGKIHTLKTKDRLFVMLTAAFALKILHSKGIIHLDLKPDNILIQEFSSNLIAKIIDFDSSILEGESIEADLLVGDAAYYSPEFSRYVATNGATPIPTKSSDIFSLGLIFCQYWTGKLPVFSSTYPYAYEAVLNGERLIIPIYGDDDSRKSKTPGSSRLKGTGIKTKTIINSGKDLVGVGVYKLIDTMLDLDPNKRPLIADVHRIIKNLYDNGIPLEHELSESDEDKSKFNGSGKSRLHGTLKSSRIRGTLKP